MYSDAESSSNARRRLPSDYISPFMDELVSPYHLPIPSQPINQEPEEDSVATISLAAFTDMSRDQVEQSFEENLVEGPSLFTKPIYESTGSWAWLNGITIGDSTDTITEVVLSEGRTFRVSLATGTAGDQTIHYVSKFCKNFRPGKWDGFLSEIALFKLALLPPQVAPTVIGIYCDAGRMSMAMAPPHHSFWMHASPEMPHSLKKRCVDAVRLLHANDILHGDLRLCNVLIGGDAKVTIINYQNSRPAFPITQPNLDLELATPAEFVLELRKFQWTLDYRGARVREEARLSELIKQGDRGNPAHVGEVRFIYSLQPDKIRPKRFVMPNQSSKDLATEIGRFMDLIVEFKALERRHIFAINPPPITRIVIPAQVANASSTTQSPAASSGYNLRSRLVNVAGANPRVSSVSPKRKLSSGAASESDSRPAKKVCFSASVDPESEDEDPSLVGSNSSPPLSLSEVSEIPYDSKRKIVETNIQRCLEFKLPHPDAIKRSPRNPCWQDPDIMEYIDRHNRDVLYKTYLMKRQPETISKIPQARRSLGGLKRALRAIAQPRRMGLPIPANHRDNALLDKGKRRGKRKRAEGDDGQDLLQSEIPDARVGQRQKISKPLDSTPHIRARMPLRGILKNPSSVMPRILAKSRHTSQRPPWSVGELSWQLTSESATGSWRYSDLDSNIAEPPSSPRLFESEPASYAHMVARWIGSVFNLLW